MLGSTILTADSEPQTSKTGTTSAEKSSTYRTWILLLKLLLLLLLLLLPLYLLLLGWMLCVLTNIVEDAERVFVRYVVGDVAILMELVVGPVVLFGLVAGFYCWC